MYFSAKRCRLLRLHCWLFLFHFMTTVLKTHGRTRDKNSTGPILEPGQMKPFLGVKSVRDRSP